MKLKIAIPLAYLILLAMGLFFFTSAFVATWKKDNNILLIGDSIQSLLTLLLFALLAWFTTWTEIKRAIVRNKWLIVISLCIAVLGGIVGYMFYDGLKAYISPLLEGLREKVKQTESLSPHFFPVMIFSNNTRVSSMTGLFFGSIPLIGFIPVFGMLFVNGALVGFLAHLPQSSVTLLLAGLAPHGILEIPAFLLSTSVATRINISILRGGYMFLRGDNARAQEEMGYALEAAKLFALIIPLLFIAAFVESYITPLVLKWVGI